MATKTKQTKAATTPADDWSDYSGEGYAETKQVESKLPSMGFSPQFRTIYLGEEEHENPMGKHRAVLIAARFSKKVEKTDADGEGTDKWVRYHVKQAKSRHNNKGEEVKLMIDGRVVYHFQCILYFEGEFYLFGSNSLTTNRFMDNPIKGQYHDKRFQAGFIPVIREFVLAKQKQYRQAVPTYAVSFGFQFLSDTIIVGHPTNKKKQSKVYRIEHDAPEGLRRVDRETMELCRQFCEDFGVDEWVDKWAKLGDGGVDEGQDSGDDQDADGQEVDGQDADNQASDEDWSDYDAPALRDDEEEMPF